ncbi:MULTISPECIES: HAD family phosphatase [unclassified Leptolyngbya]|uniref:HAD family hydrolase n=1 Tax=unclassified Leptolyngbya TaxID=2650499 RepID=UPI001687C05D|nr:MULTISPECIES: HAD family phosphatase [unclassified Leptolyngbya]MBD1909079.1 HAD family phosphatase [Leptolyngbya sp. FACHB-8]MBD2157010.1 HAD family phosphatase [Leptolyngbya sp. FACHB-16]
MSSHSTSLEPLKCPAQPSSPSRVAPQAPYAALIFDCDGTIAHTLPVHFEAWQATLGEFGAVLPEDWYYERTGLTAAKFLQEFNQAFGYAIDIQRLEVERQRHFSRLVHRVQAVPAVAAIAHENYGRVPMAIASNGQRSVVEPTIESIGLRSLFNTIVTINDVKVGKPEPDLFLLAAERMGVAPQECIVYEDSDVGLEAAERAGMRWVDVRILGAK